MTDASTAATSASRGTNAKCPDLHTGPPAPGLSSRALAAHCAIQAQPAVIDENADNCFHLKHGKWFPGHTIGVSNTDSEPSN